MTIATALRDAAARLDAVSDTARLDAELLLAHAAGATRTELLLRLHDAPVPPGFADLVARRLNHEPVAYIIGHQDFMGLQVRVTPAVLIPRSDSETVVEAALRARPGAARVLDCGTGSGALLLAALDRLGWASGTGIDRSAAALAIAQDNAARLGLAQRAQFVRADWHHKGWNADLDRFDLILANPPYVEQDAPLAPDVRDHEPAGALFAGPDGLDDYRVLVPQLPALLTPGGVAVVEIGAAQAAAVTALGAAAGLTAQLHRDLAGRPRALEFKI